ncbi:MAG: hypothetical protein ACE1Z6_07710, partial [Candidatus Methylomirabilales bacterium]
TFEIRIYPWTLNPELSTMNHETMRIAIDIDDVLADSLSEFLVPHQLFFTSIPRWCGTFASPESVFRRDSRPIGTERDSTLSIRLAEHPPGVGEPLPYNPSVPLAEPWGA